VTAVTTGTRSGCRSAELVDAAHDKVVDLPIDLQSDVEAAAAARSAFMASEPLAHAARAACSRDQCHGEARPYSPGLDDLHGSTKYRVLNFA